jgi:hypothetical protein
MRVRTAASLLVLAIVGVVATILLACGGGGASGADPSFDHPELTYVHLVRQDPRPLHIHVLQFDVTDPRLSLALDMLPDPDGANPAETALERPITHAERGGFLAGANANPWRMIDASGGTGPAVYVVGGPCDVSGWVVADGVERSPVQSGHWSFWVDDGGNVGIGNLASPPPTSVRWAVAGFGGLLQGGAILPTPSTNRPPRTALGVKPDGHTLVLVVVDGRQDGYSEGMTTYELAELMLELGCVDALNLDGGGSSAMVVRDTAGTLRIVNSPSDLTGARPIPLLFGVRRSG